MNPAQPGTEPADPASDQVMGATIQETMSAADLDGTAGDLASTERRKLIHLCLYALDRARSAGVAERIVDGLAAVGVCPVSPDGQRFDPAHHEAGGTTPTSDPALEGLIAETEVVGFLDRGQLLRAPIVTVYVRAAEVPAPAEAGP